MEGDDDDRWVIRTSGNLCFSAIEDGKSYFLYTYIIIRQRWRQLPRALQHWIVPQRDILFLVQGSFLPTRWWSLIILLPGSVAQLDDLSNIIKLPKSLFGFFIDGPLLVQGGSQLVVRLLQRFLSLLQLIQVHWGIFQVSEAIARS